MCGSVAVRACGRGDVGSVGVGVFVWGVGCGCTRVFVCVWVFFFVKKIILMCLFVIILPNTSQTASRH